MAYCCFDTAYGIKILSDLDEDEVPAGMSILKAGFEECGDEDSFLVLENTVSNYESYCDLSNIKPMLDNDARRTEISKFVEDNNIPTEGDYGVKILVSAGL